MANFQLEERAKLKKHWVDQAIALAMQNRWDDAVKLNQTIIEVFPQDVDAYNRLGRAQTETGHFKEAREAYQRAIELDPTNSIAKKNLARLASVKAEVAHPPAQRVDPRMFIAETGKTGVVSLLRPAPRDVLARMSAGDEVQLTTSGRVLTVGTASGDYLGQIEPKIGQRLLDLMRGGNRYTAAVMNMDDTNLKIIIRETYQSPSNVGKLSFPVRGEIQGVRPYTRETLLKYDTEYEEEEDDGEIDENDLGMETEIEEPEEGNESPDFDDEHGPE